MSWCGGGRNLLVSWAVVALVATAQAGCGCGDDDDDGAPRVEAIIGPSGGELVSGDQRVWLVVPPNAVDEERTFFIEESPAPTPPGALGIPYEIGVVGLNEVELAEPATIVLYYDDAQLEGRSRYGLHGATWAAGAIDWICISFSALSTQEEAALVLSTSHLSTWVPRYLPCEDDSACDAPQKCVVTGDSEGFCAIPCLEDRECPSPMSCTDDHVCTYSKCYGDDVPCPDGTVCSVTGPNPGVCLEPCVGEMCGDLSAQQNECTAGGHCVFTQLCSDDNPICDPGFQDCMHGWCVARYQGCDCATPGCPCIDGGNDQDISGVWYHRYNCASRADGSCGDEDGCADTTLVAGAEPNQWVGEGDDFVGTLVGNVLHWELHDVDFGSYTELGTWTFSADFQTFTQQSCYAYDATDTVDPETWTCDGPTTGDCTATGARDSAGPPAAVGSCPEGQDGQSCP